MRAAHRVTTDMMEPGDVGIPFLCGKETTRCDIFLLCLLVWCSQASVLGLRLFFLHTASNLLLIYTVLLIKMWRITFAINSVDYFIYLI